jgi:2-polyprenyl-3-methyl-5-hydroxy-6-metoxy-1,4-benzoquinol methylase
MMDPKVIGKDYDLILCIDGPEHITQQYQEGLIWKFYDALKPGGTLLVSMPETEKSGPSEINPYHLGELSFEDFVKLFYEFDSVQIISHEDTLHNGVKSNCLYGIAKKGE